MHPVQDHVNTFGINCLIQWLTEYIVKYERGNNFPTQSVTITPRQHKSTLAQQIPLQKKNLGMCRRGNRTHDLLRARQTPKRLVHQVPRMYRSVTNLLMDKVGLSWGSLQTPQYTQHRHLNRRSIT